MRAFSNVIFREQSCDTLVALHCKPLARLLPGYAASKSSKQSFQGCWTPFTYIAARRKTSVVSWWNTYIFWIVNFLYYIRGPLWCIYWSLFVWTQRNDMHFYLGRRPTNHLFMHSWSLGKSRRSPSGQMGASKCCTANHTVTQWRAVHFTPRPSLVEKISVFISVVHLDPLWVFLRFTKWIIDTRIDHSFTALPYKVPVVVMIPRPCPRSP